MTKPGHKQPRTADVIEDLRFMRDTGEGPLRAFIRLRRAGTYYGDRDSLMLLLRRNGAEDVREWLDRSDAGHTGNGLTNTES